MSPTSKKISKTSSQKASSKTKASPTTTAKKKASKIMVKNLTTKKVAGPKKNVSEPEAVLEKKSEKKTEEKAPSLLRPYKESIILGDEKLEDEKTGKTSGSKTYRNIAIFFAIGALAMLTFVFYFSFVKMTITIIPEEEQITEEAIITVYDKSRTAQIPSTLESVEGVIEKIEIKEEKTYQSGGVDVIGEEVVGKVKIINNYNKNQPLVATTRLLSPDKKLYRIKETINVPAGGSVEVAVYADKASPEMAIGPSQFTIPGLWAGLQDKIYAESSEKFVYQQQTKKYIIQRDIDSAMIDIKKYLIESAIRKFGSNYKGYDYVVYDLDENSIKSETKGKIGEEKENFSISMSADVVVVAFYSKALENLGFGKLSVMVPDNKKLIEFNRENINCSLESFDLNQGSARLKTGFSGTMSLREGMEILDPAKIVGLSQSQLTAYLNKIDGIKQYKINFSPSFINRAPKLIDRIIIEIKPASR